MHKAMHITVCLLAAFIFFRYLLGFFAPFLAGLAIALLLEPLVRFLCRRGNFKRGLASFVALLLLALFAASLAYWGVSALTREAAELLAVAPVYISNLQEWLADYPFIPADGLLAWASEWISRQSLQAVVCVPGALIALLLILLSAFFFSRDRDMIFALLVKWCPDWLAQYLNPIGTRLYDSAAGFLKTELILIFMVAGICIIAFLILGNPYALMLGLLIALFDSLPIVGSGLVLWPWAGYLAFVGQHSHAAGLLVLYGIITVLRNIVGPRILGSQIGMHPLAAVMAIFMGLKAFGAVGLLAGPALLITAMAMFEEKEV